MKVPPLTRSLAGALSIILAGACTGADEASLGPVDGRELSPADTGRVAVGDMAPDFSLAAFGGDEITLSDFRGQKDVILVFYRGHW